VAEGGANPRDASGRTQGLGRAGRMGGLRVCCFGFSARHYLARTALSSISFVSPFVSLRPTCIHPFRFSIQHTPSCSRPFAHVVGHPTLHQRADPVGVGLSGSPPMPSRQPHAQAMQLLPWLSRFAGPSRRGTKSQTARTHCNDSTPSTSIASAAYPSRDSPPASIINAG
jgi:hypothetical protein